MTRTDVENDKVKPCILELYGSRQSGKVHCVKKRSEFKHGMMVHMVTPPEIGIQNYPLSFGFKDLGRNDVYIDQKYSL